MLYVLRRIQKIFEDVEMGLTVNFALQHKYSSWQKKLQSRPKELKTAQQQTRQHVTNVAGLVHSFARWEQMSAIALVR